MRRPRIRRSPPSRSVVSRFAAGSFVLLVIGCVAAVGSVVAADSTSWDPRQPSTAGKSHPVVYDGELHVTVTAPYKSKRLRVWFPVPPTEHGQTVMRSEFTTFPESVAPTFHTESLFGNRFAYFEFPNPQGAQVVRHRFQIEIWEQRWNLDPARIVPVREWPASFEPFRRSESQAVVADARFTSLLKEIVPEPENPLRDLTKVMRWTSDHFRYDHAAASLRASSLHALEHRRGHCSDYHGFCAAMGRVLNQPTRVAYGIHTYPKASPSHCKLEAFLPPHGWVSFDVSETQKMSNAIQSNESLRPELRELNVAAAHARLAEGFSENSWFVQTRGTDYDLAPPASARVPVVRTIYAEADGKPLEDPDPSDPTQVRFAWMTAQRFSSDQPVSRPFVDLDTLRDWVPK